MIIERMLPRTPKNPTKLRRIPFDQNSNSGYSGGEHGQSP
jgi:hypothetical protein